MSNDLVYKLALVFRQYGPFIELNSIPAFMEASDQNQERAVGAMTYARTVAKLNLANSIGEITGQHPDYITDADVDSVIGYIRAKFPRQAPPVPKPDIHSQIDNLAVDAMDPLAPFPRVTQSEPQDGLRYVGPPHRRPRS